MTIATSHGTGSDGTRPGSDKDDDKDAKESKQESVVEKRLKQNREAARRSRERKRQLKEELRRRMPLLQKRHNSMVVEVDELMKSMWVRLWPPFQLMVTETIEMRQRGPCDDGTPQNRCSCQNVLSWSFRLCETGTRNHQSAGSELRFPCSRRL